MPENSSSFENGSGGSMSVTEVTGLVQLFNNQLLAMEGRIVAKMDDNSRAASERWVKHDHELEVNTKRIVSRFEAVESSILTVEKALKTHLDREHDEEVASQARVQPIKGFVAWFWRNWRDVLLLAIGIIALLTFLTDWFGHVLGLVPPT